MSEREEPREHAPERASRDAPEPALEHAADDASGADGARPHGGRVPIEALIDVERLARLKGRPPTSRELRAALPRGYVLEDDGRHARRDLRLVFREGWILILGMVCFGAVALLIFYQAFPRGWRGLATFLALITAVLIAGGLVAPMITRALYRRRGG